ncbi:hypothetical protein M7I_4121 [Glarea lozoyensis 74030]|uniref:Uncharacterized protein n=1 Tax=Glarea lozoyensis (strain ATCC 74030 / MF5533) TaxID=1104152 RepID=H0ENB8_GLAL7|nr:hypothetical protein M7I_4121 [Glarea lozoyensis 74030]
MGQARPYVLRLDFIANVRKRSNAFEITQKFKKYAVFHFTAKLLDDLALY